MNQPEHILRILDRHLRQPTRLILYGRAALALGFPQPLADFFATLDVDAILPEVEMRAIEEDDGFWEAIERTNHELDSSGLYITHLFSDSQVILRHDWLNSIVPVLLPNLRFLSLFRPSAEDLILTKMMRVDPQDRQDIQYLLKCSSISPSDMEICLSKAKVPAVPEIEAAFLANSDWILTQFV